MSIWVFSFIYLFFSIFYAFVSVLIHVFGFVSLKNFMSRYSLIGDFLNVVTFVSPFWFLMIVVFSFICRDLVKKRGNDFVVLALRTKLKFGVFREIVDFEEINRNKKN